MSGLWLMGFQEQTPKRHMRLKKIGLHTQKMITILDSIFDMIWGGGSK